MLQAMLAAHPRMPLRVFVVWATVVEGDNEPPSGEALATLKDPRVVQFWDPTRSLADQVREAAKAGVKQFADYKPGGHTPYDFVALYPQNAEWVVRIPAPLYHGSPVATSIGALEEKLAALAR